MDAYILQFQADTNFNKHNNDHMLNNFGILLNANPDSIIVS